MVQDVAVCVNAGREGDKPQHLAVGPCLLQLLVGGVAGIVGEHFIAFVQEEPITSAVECHAAHRDAFVDLGEQILAGKTRGRVVIDVNA